MLLDLVPSHSNHSLPPHIHHITAPPSPPRPKKEKPPSPLPHPTSVAAASSSPRPPCLCLGTSRSSSSSSKKQQTVEARHQRQASPFRTPLKQAASEERSLSNSSYKRHKAIAYHHLSLLHFPSLDRSRLSFCHASSPTTCLNLLGFVDTSHTQARATPPHATFH